MTSAQCKETVYDRSNSWSRGTPCTRAAVTEAGYCRQHDPELRKSRSAARPPCKWQRRNLARDQLQAFLAEKLSPGDLAIATRGIAWGYADWANPPWPLDITKGTEAQR